MKSLYMKTPLVLLTLFFTVVSMAQVVRFETNHGNIEIEMFPDVAPVTVANFLNYVNRGDYDDTVIHRTDPGFIIQGGGYNFLGNNAFQGVPTDAPIINEAQISNTTGTIAMARTSDLNSATSQWFFNMNNNTGLDIGSESGGFAVFGEVTSGMETLYVIESFLRVNYFNATPAGVFGQFPLFRFDSDGSSGILEENIVKINRAYVLSDTFQISAGISGGWVNQGTLGQGFYFEVLPSADTMIMAWFAYDSVLPDPEVPSSVGDAGNRWLTASGTYQGNQFVGNVFKSSGGLFDDPAPVSTTPVGEVTITFNNCSTGVLEYTLNDGSLSNSINIQRVSGVNVDFCEQLSNEANQGD